MLDFLVNQQDKLVALKRKNYAQTVTHTDTNSWDNERMLHFLFSSFVVNIWLQTKYFSIYFFFIKFLSAVDLTKSQTCLCFFQGKSLILVIVNMVSPELLRWQLRWLSDTWKTNTGDHHPVWVTCWTNRGYSKQDIWIQATDWRSTSVHHYHNASLVAYIIKRETPFSLGNQIQYYWSRTSPINICYLKCPSPELVVRK